MRDLIAGSGLFHGLLFAPLVPGVSPGGEYLVRDFTQGFSSLPTLQEAGFEHDIGRYNERRRAMYTSSLFGESDPWSSDDEGVRDIHMGIDIGGTAGTKCCAVADGEIHSAGYNAAELDYGHGKLLLL